MCDIRSTLNEINYIHTEIHDTQSQTHQYTVTGTHIYKDSKRLSM